MTKMIAVRVKTETFIDAAGTYTYIRRMFLKDPNDNKLIRAIIPNVEQLPINLNEVEDGDYKLKVETPDFMDNVKQVDVKTG